MQVGASPVEQTDDGGVDVPHLVGRVVRSPIFGLAGCTRRRGRRQPYSRTRRYEVEGEAQTKPSRLGKDGERPGRDMPVLERGHHVLDRPDLGWSQSMGRRARTGRLIVKCTRVLQRRHVWNQLGDNRRNRRTARNGTNSRARSTARRILILVCPSGRRSCDNWNPEHRSRARTSRRSAVSFFTRRRSSRTSCRSSDSFRSVTSRLTTTFGALPSYRRAVERGTPDPLRWSRPRCPGRDPEADGR